MSIPEIVHLIIGTKASGTDYTQSYQSSSIERERETRGRGEKSRRGEKLRTVTSKTPSVAFNISSNKV